MGRPDDKKKTSGGSRGEGKSGDQGSTDSQKMRESGAGQSDRSRQQKPGSASGTGSSAKNSGSKEGSAEGRKNLDAEQAQEGDAGGSAPTRSDRSGGSREKR